MANAENVAAGSVIRFAGLRFHPLDVAQTVAALATRDAGAPFAIFTTPNVEHAYLRREYPEMAIASDTAIISTNDSRILRRAAKMAGLDLGFAPGAHVIPELFREAIRPDDALSIIGGSPDLADKLRAQFGLTNLKIHVPPMGFINDDQAVRAAIEFVAANPSRFVFVAMGPPQSEQFCVRVMKDGRATGIGLCIGSSLVVLTGESQAAPDWMERGGMVWLYRLVKEPRRLWRRYLVRGLYGVALCAIDVLKIRLGGRRAIA